MITRPLVDIVLSKSGSQLTLGYVNKKSDKVFVNFIQEN